VTGNMVVKVKKEGNKSSGRAKALLEDKIKKVAIAEVLQPEFELTKQYLNVNELIFKEDVPVIETVIIDKGKNEARVYFPVKGENYYFLIYMDIRPLIKVRIMCMAAGNWVSLYVISKNTSLKKLLRTSGMEPTSKWEKGEKRTCGRGTYRFSGFTIQPDETKAGEVEEKIEKLLNQLRPHNEEIQKLLEIADVELDIAYFGYKDEMWGLNFKSELIQKMAELGISIDIDLYASGPDLE